MKKISFLATILACFAFHYGNAQIVPPRKPTSHLSEMGLKGNVHTYKITSYKAIDSFGIIKRSSSPDHWRGDVVSVFDRDGYKSEVNYYDKEHKLYQKVMYKYNANRKRTSRDVYDSEGKILQKNIYVYDQKGHKKSYKGYNAKGEVVELFMYKNDDKGRELEEYCTKTNYSVCGKYTHSYDEQGRVVQLCRYTKTVGDADNCEKYTYDKQGLITQTEFYEKNSLVHKLIFEYDKSRNEISERMYDNNGDFVQEKEFVYKYDSKGNWVERVEYIDGFPRTVAVRDIKYY